MQKTPEADHNPSIWSHKPWWCQPWSILLTGLLAITLSWLWLQICWLSGLVAAAVVAWWGVFLVLVPRAWKDMIESGEPED